MNGEESQLPFGFPVIPDRGVGGAPCVGRGCGLNCLSAFRSFRTPYIECNWMVHGEGSQLPFGFPVIPDGELKTKPFIRIVWSQLPFGFPVIPD